MACSNINVVLHSIIGKPYLNLRPAFGSGHVPDIDPQLDQLVLESIVLFLLIFVMAALKGWKDFKGHQKLLALATALNLLAVPLLMVPRF
jgi:hypothetical protein